MTTRYLVGFTCFIAVLITALSLLMPHSTLWFFASNSPVYAIGRLLVVLVLLSYMFIPSIRFKLFKSSLLVLGSILVYLGIAGLLPSDSVGLHNYYPQLLDVFLFLESGITCLLCALELPSIEKNTLSYTLLNYFNRLLTLADKAKPEAKLKAAR